MSKQRLALILATVFAIGGVAVGCGDSGSDTPAANTTPPASTTPSTPPTDTSTPPPASGGDAAAGKTVFTANCGGCHTLADAAASGTVGPNLDNLKPDSDTVKNKVINGGGPMPAFGKDGILNDTQIADVAAYVSSKAGA